MEKHKHNYKLSESEKKEIAISYYLDRSNTNITELSNKYGISRQYIYQLVKKKETKELVKKCVIEDSPNFIKRIDKIIDASLDKIEYKLETDDTDKTTYRDLAIMIGTLYDKSRLEKNLSTENKAIEINIKVEH